MSTADLTELLLSERPAGSGIYSLSEQRIVERIQSCRTDRLGGRILSCPHCRARVVVYNPCHQRGCPRCAETVRLQWRRRMQKRLLPVGHMHITFTAPEELTEAWQRTPKTIINGLFASINRTCKLEIKRSGLNMGFMLIFHSHGSGMSFKAHMHAIVTAGGIDASDQWKTYRRFSEPLLRQDFRRILISELTTKISPRIVQELQNASDESWRVYSVHHPQHPDALIGYFARSLHGLVFDPNDSFIIDDASVEFTTHHQGKTQTTKLDRSEFIRRYFAHIPPVGAVTIRHYGIYATRHAKQLKQAREKIPQESMTKRRVVPEETIRRCPECHQIMRVVIIFEENELPPILAYLKRIRGSPLEHGELIQPVEITA